MAAPSLNSSARALRDWSVLSRKLRNPSIKLPNMAFANDVSLFTFSPVVLPKKDNMADVKGHESSGSRPPKS